MLTILMGLSRRSYLALCTAGSLVGVSGCFEHPGEKRCLYLNHLPEPDARITNAPEIGEIPPRSQPTGIPIDEDRLQSEVGEIAEHVIAGETITTYGHRPIEHGTHVQSDGRYYVFEYREGATEHVERWTLTAEPVDEPTEQPADLQDFDEPFRTMLRIATETEIVFREINPDPADLGLLPEPDPPYIYTISPPDGEPEPKELVMSQQTIEETRYTYHAVRLSADAAAFVDDTITVVEDLELSEDELTILEMATDGVYDPDENGDPDAYRSLQDQLDMSYLRFDDAVYRTEFTWLEGGIDCPAEPPG